ncbi:hypothetical protein D3C71_1210900 [compost metagenome]
MGTKNSCGGTAIACNSVLNAVRNSQPSGKNSSRATPQAAAVRRASRPSGKLERRRFVVVMSVAPSYLSRFLPTMRIRNTAAILASNTANSAPAEATPASKLSSACLKIRKVTLVLASPGPPPVVV